MKSDLLKVRERSLLLVLLTTVFLLPFIPLMSCNGGGGEPSSISRKLFVVNRDANTVSVFDADAIDAGATPIPIRTIGSKTELFLPQGVFVDTKNNEVFVTNSQNNTITVYGRTDAGDVSPIRTIGGPGTMLDVPRGIFLDTEKDLIYVANAGFGNNTITVYKNDRTKVGDIDILPMNTIVVDDTGLSFRIEIFVDTENDFIFVGNSGFVNSTITIYKRTNAGDVALIQTILVDSTGFSSLGIFVDVKNDELFVVDSVAIPGGSSVPIQPVFESTIKVYKGTPEGNFSLSRTIEGPNTGLFNPVGISVDTKSNEIFVANSGFGNNTITVYGRMAQGDTPPLRTLSILDSNNAGIRVVLGLPSGIFLDINNNEIFVSNLNNTITVYRRTDEGDATPLRIIGPNTGLLEPQWMYVDTENSEIFVSNSSSQLITVYGITDEGNVTPLRTIPQGLLVPQGIFVDTENNEIFVVANFGGAGVVTVHRTTDGIPLKHIFGSHTGLSNPQGIFVDTKNNQIFVANLGNNTITVYGRTDKGDVTPVRTIGAEKTELSAPLGIYVDTDNNEIFVANSGDDTITVYKRTESGDFTLSGTIQQGLSLPQGIFVDTENNEIFVANSGDDTITVYERTDSGDFTLSRTIKRENTGLDGPFGIFVAESP